MRARGEHDLDRPFLPETSDDDSWSAPRRETQELFLPRSRTVTGGLTLTQIQAASRARTGAGVPSISATGRLRAVPALPPIELPPAELPVAQPAQPAQPGRPAGRPLTRREARALQGHAGSAPAPGAPAADDVPTRALTLRAPSPQSRAERRAADRLAARDAAATSKAARGQRAAITVALVGLGVAMINKGGAVEDLLTTSAAPVHGPATPTGGIRLPDADSAAYFAMLDEFDNRQVKAAFTVRPSRTKSASASPSASDSPSTSAAARAVAGEAVKRLYGTPRSGLPWLSGWWAGGPQNNGTGINEAGDWRGAKMDMATAYTSYGSWDEMRETNLSLFEGFGGRVAYGLPLLPQDRAGQWDDVLSGAHDEVFRNIARDLVAKGFGDSPVRVGLEANGDWFAWGAPGTEHAAQFKAAFRHVVKLMKAEAPKLTFWFDTSATANIFPGTSGRGQMLAALYPGDDVVDGISMDHYDFYGLVAKTDQAFEEAMRPPTGTGLQDAVDFARAHGKGFAVPEWGVHDTQGAGDNPFFIKKMFEFFQANKDVLVFENYFNEPDAYIANALIGGQNPQSAAMYQKLWGGR